MVNEGKEDIIDLIPCGFISFTDAGNIIRINNTLLDYLGYTHTDFTHKKIENILTLSSRIFYQTHFYPLVQLQGKADEIFLTLLSKSRTEVPVLANARKRITDNAAEFYCVFIPVEQRGKYEDRILQAKKTAEDSLYNNEALIEAKQQLELHKKELDRKINRLQQINRELLQVNQVISHDLQEPLRKISLFTDILSRSNQNVQLEEHQALDKIKHSSSRIREIILNLEKLVYLIAEEDSSIEIDLNEVMLRVRSQVENEHDTNNYTILTEPLPLIEAYAGQMEILFYNLIDNSLKFRHPEKNPVIHISNTLIQGNSFKTTTDKYKYIDFVKITYSDNSLGFDDKYREYVFMILKKLHPDMPGLGFGLPVCKKVVENHLGSITLDTSPGEGVTLTILLPLKQHA